MISCSSQAKGLLGWPPQRSAVQHCRLVDYVSLAFVCAVPNFTSCCNFQLAHLLSSSAEEGTINVACELTLALYNPFLLYFSCLSQRVAWEEHQLHPLYPGVHSQSTKSGWPNIGDRPVTVPSMTAKTSCLSRQGPLCLGRAIGENECNSKSLCSEPWCTYIQSFPSCQR